MKGERMSAMMLEKNKIGRVRVNSAMSMYKCYSAVRGLYVLHCELKHFCSVRRQKQTGTRVVCLKARRACTRPPQLLD